jgi:hypothetical protein
MHVPRLIRKAEVAKCELNEVDNDEEEAFPEVGTAPYVNEAESEQVVGDEVWSEIAGMLDVFGRVVGGGIEGSEVRDLEGVEDDPGTC